jgi:hypothetical protein
MTELLRYTTPEMLQSMARQFSARADGAVGEPSMVKTIEQGAATTVWAALVASDEEVGGRYCEDCHVAHVAESGGEGVRPYALDVAKAEALWLKSETMVAEHF